VLFAGLERHPERAVSERIYGNADNPTRHVAFKIFFGSKKCSVWSAVTHRHTKTLARTNGNIGTPFARRCEQSKAQQIGGNGNNNALFVGFFSKFRKILNISFVVGILDDGSKKQFSKFNLFVTAKKQLNSQRQSAGFDYVNGLWEKCFGNKKLVCTSFYGSSRPRIESHNHGFGSGGAFVEQ